MVRLALVTSVTWRPVSFQISQVSMVPNSKLAALGPLPRASDVIEQPADLRPGEVGRQRQTAALAEAVHAAVPRQVVDQVGGAGVLPHHRVGDRLAGLPIPQQRRLALIGDADRGEIVRTDVQRGHRLGDDRLDRAPDLQRVVLDPPRSRKDLAMLPPAPAPRPARRRRRSCSATRSCPGRWRRCSGRSYGCSRRRELFVEGYKLDVHVSREPQIACVVG